MVSYRFPIHNQKDDLDDKNPFPNKSDSIQFYSQQVVNSLLPTTTTTYTTFRGIKMVWKFILMLAILKLASAHWKYGQQHGKHF